LTVLVPSPNETVEVTLCLREKNGTVHSADIRRQGYLMLTESQQNVNQGGVYRWTNEQLVI